MMKTVGIISFVVVSSLSIESAASIKAVCGEFYQGQIKNPEEIKVEAMANKLRTAMARTGKSVADALVLLVGTDSEFRTARKEISGFDKKVKDVLAKPSSVLPLEDADGPIVDKIKENPMKLAPRFMPSQNFGNSYSYSDISPTLNIPYGRVHKVEITPAGNVLVGYNRITGQHTAISASYPGFKVNNSVEGLYFWHGTKIFNDDFSVAAEAPFPQTAYNHLQPQTHFGGVGGWVFKKSGDSFFLRESYGAFTIVKAKDPSHRHQYHFSKFLEYTEREGIQMRHNIASFAEFANGDFITVYNGSSGMSGWDGTNFYTIRNPHYGSFFSYWKFDPHTKKYDEVIDRETGGAYTHSDPSDREGITGAIVLKNDSLVTYNEKGETRIWKNSGHGQLFQIGQTNIQDLLVQKLGNDEIEAFKKIYKNGIVIRNMTELADGKLAMLAMHKYILILAPKDGGSNFDLHDILTAPVLEPAVNARPKYINPLGDGTFLTTIEYRLPENLSGYTSDFDRVLHWKP